MTMHVYYFMVMAYLLGSIPFGLLFVKWAGLGDVRDIGSGNIGTTNVLRTGNRWIAAATLLADLLKGLIPLLVIKGFSDIVLDQVLVAGAAVIGHIYPIWLKFKGGKGVATALGTLFGLMPILGLCVALLWIVLAVVVRISSLAALVAFISSPLIAYMVKAPDELIIYCMILSLLILWTHRANISRLSRGDEGNLKL